MKILAGHKISGHFRYFDNLIINMTELYPLKFETILKKKIWGGNVLQTGYNKKYSVKELIGESWELSAIEGDKSVISNGFLAGNNIEELIEVYMGDLVGDSVYEKFGNEFPLLIKFIEARQDLSIQVHPGNELAKRRHNAYGKTEMWYILECEKDARLLSGFKEPVTKEVFQKSLSTGKLVDLLNPEKVEVGDAFFNPAGRVHCIGSGMVLVEIQQTSDITYRIFDWNREKSGQEIRELHVDLALEAIDFNSTGTSKVRKEPMLNNTLNIVYCEYFNTNILRFNQPVNKEYLDLDSFVIYICTEGSFSIRWDDASDKVEKGETVLIPAMINNLVLDPHGEAQLLEVYIKSETL